MKPMILWLALASAVSLLALDSLQAQEKPVLVNVSISSLSFVQAPLTLYWERSRVCPSLRTPRSPSRVSCTRGTFGEWLGYYGSEMDNTPVVRVERIYHRNDPILCCARPGRPPTDYSLANCVIIAAHIWDHVEKAGLPNVKGVWCLEPGVGRLFNVISIKQAYPGHARQALYLASQVLGGAYIGRFVVVVDDDIDPTSTFDVLWAMATRCDPEKSIEILRRCWSGALDVAIAPENRGLNSRALIDACKPYERRDEFPPVAESGEELKAKVREKWRDLIYG